MRRTLEKKTIVLAVCGSIAAVRCVELAHALRKRGARVIPVMSAAAQKIIHPYALQYACAHEVITEITGAVEHVQWCGVGGEADVLLIAPATSNTISKIAHGIDDTPVSTFATTALSHMPVLVAPAMHESMYSQPFVSRSLDALKEVGVVVIGPVLEEGKAKIASTEHIVLEVERACGTHELEGVRTVVSAGATAEPWDDVRILTSRASGRTGNELALELYRRGAEVVLVHPKLLDYPPINQRMATTSSQMLKACLEECAEGCDVFIASAAISDYTPIKVEGKVASNIPDMSVSLEPTPKVLKEVAEAAKNVLLVGFKAEANVSDAVLEQRARKLMDSYGLSMVVANDISKGGMGTQDNRVLIVAEGTKVVEGEKDEIAYETVNEIVKILGYERDGKGAAKGKNTLSDR